MPIIDPETDPSTAAGFAKAAAAAPHKQMAVLAMDLAVALKRGDMAAAEVILKKIEDLKRAETAVEKLLCDCRVDHKSTMGMSWDQISELRKPVILEGFLRHGTVMMLAAESKSRKSWLAQDIAFCVATGTPWLPGDEEEGFRATQQARVHVFDLELDSDEMRFRFATARGHRFKGRPDLARQATENINAYSLDGLGADLIMRMLSDLQPSVKPGDLVIFDCFYRVQPDGNEASEVAAILERLKRFASDTQCGMIIVDHFRKAGADNARDRISGSFVKMASAATLASIEVKDDILTINVDARTFHGISKVNAQFDLDSYTFRQIPETDVEDAKEKAKTDKAVKDLRKAYSGRPLTAALSTHHFTDAWRGTKQATTKKLKGFEELGLVKCRKGENGKPDEWELSPKFLLLTRTDNQTDNQL